MGLLKRFNPDNAYLCARNTDKVYLSKAPTLSECAEVYGEDLAHSWLEIQLFNLSEYAGNDKKPDLSQIKEAARSIAACYYFLTLPEMLLFFVRFKAGQYGKFYGAIDFLTVSEAIKTKFLPERRAEAEAAERRKKKEEAEAYEKEHRAIVCTRDEYEMLKRRAAQGDAAAMKRLSERVG